MSEQKHVVRFVDGSGYAVFDVATDDVISPVFPTEEHAQHWLDDFLLNEEQSSEAA